MHTIKWVILDLDNTLYDYENPNTQWNAAVLNHAHIQLGITKEDLEDAILWARRKNHDNIPTHGASHSRLIYFQKALEKLTGKTHFELTLELESIFWDTFMEHMQLHDNVIKFLDHLKKHNKKILILTDLTAQIQKKKIIKLWIHQHIDYLVSSEEAWAEKPDPKIFELSLEKLGLKKEEVCMIGDNYEKDIVWAKNFGIYKVYHKINGEWNIGVEDDVIRFRSFDDIIKDFK